MAGLGYEIDFMPVGKTKHHSYNMPERSGWVASTSVPFHSQVEGN